MSGSPVLRARGRLAAATKHHPDQEHQELRADLAAAKLEDAIRRTLAAAPPLTPAQRARLRDILA